MLQLLIGGSRRYEEPMSVPCPQGLLVQLCKRAIHQRNSDIPAVKRPIILVPPMLVCTIGMTSPSSASKAEKKFVLPWIAVRQ